VTRLLVHPSPVLRGAIRVPGDKSISHRAVMLSALSEGSSKLKGMLMGEDVLSTVGCFREMGVPIEIKSGEVTVHGVGLKGLKAPQRVLDCGNSGTTLRLMMGLLAAQPFVSRLTGDASLNRRPVERVAHPLRLMGAQIEELRSSETERVVKITGRPLNGIRYELPVASAQVKSAILLAGLFASGSTQVVEKIPSRDHTEIMLQAKGAPLQKNGLQISVQAASKLLAIDLEIPGDISSAAFFLVGGLLGKTSSVRLTHVGVNPTRTGILEVLGKMGAKLKLQNQRWVGGEAIADLEVESSSLKGVEVGGDIIPRLIDEIPILAIAAASVQGTTWVRDAIELRVKESDRIAAIEREFQKMGAQIETFPDGFKIQGPIPFQAGVYASGGDHRIAMAWAIAATQAEADSTIEDVDCIQTSYPEFFEDFRHLGASIEVL